MGLAIVIKVIYCVGKRKEKGLCITHAGINTKVSGKMMYFMAEEPWLTQMDKSMTVSFLMVAPVEKVYSLNSMGINMRDNGWTIYGMVMASWNSVMETFTKDNGRMDRSMEKVIFAGLMEMYMKVIG